MKKLYYCLAAGVMILVGCSSNIESALEKIPSKPLPSSPGLAIAIVYDTSGSMDGSVPDSNGKKVPKYKIANRAFKNSVDHIQNYILSAPRGETRDVMISVVTFNGFGGVITQLGPEHFDRDRLLAWLDKFPGCDGGTPLGDAIILADANLNYCNKPQRHIIVLTDGQCNIGISPHDAVQRAKNRNKGDYTLGTYFIAFDVDSSLFADVKNAGAMLVSASNEPQLVAQLNNIVTTKILLEDPDE